MSWSPLSSQDDSVRSYGGSKHDISFLLHHPPKPSHSHASSSPISSSTTSLSCTHCTYLASSPDNLASHVRSSHRVKPFACKLCNKTFAERGNANKHYRVAHLKQRNHRCQTCHRCFAFRDGLNRHIAMVHLNQRPFECTECMCPRGPHPSSVPCTHICGMRFKQKSHRRRHVQSVHHAGSKARVSSRSSYQHSQPPLLRLGNTPAPSRVS